MSGKKRFTVGGTFLSVLEKERLAATAKLIASPGKGITACDEGPGTIGSRFEAVGIENSAETRRLYRQMLFETPHCEEYLSGAILDPETLLQRSSSELNRSKPFPQVLSEKGIIPGVKPHLKVYKLPGTGGDTVMQGLDSLAERCQTYYAAGARFAKWRSPFTIDTPSGRPTDLAIESNMRDLARYALICQSQGLVPIVEPDVSLTGTHTLGEAIDVNIRIQSTLFKAMIDHGVYMAGTILKSNIVNPGRDCRTPYSVEEIAQANVFVFEQAFPVAMPGANYLSGGQTLQDATARLCAINKVNKKGPWNLSFSFSQAFQLPLLELCQGKGGELQLEDMSKLYLEELQIASAAAKGEHVWKVGEGDHNGIADHIAKKQKT